MICDLCGHNNPQANRFCGMCGMPLESAVFKPDQEAHEPVRESVPSSSLGMEATGSAGVAAKPGWQSEPISSLWDRHPVTPSSPKQTEQPSPWERPQLSHASSATTAPPSSPAATRREPRAVSASTAGSTLGLSDLPVRGPATRVSRPATISGPSFLGLDRLETENPGYLLEDEETRSHWRGYLAALVVILVGLLVSLQWRSEVKVQASKVGTALWARLHTPTPQARVEQPSTSTAGNISEPAPSTPSASNASQSSVTPSNTAQSQSSSDNASNVESKPPPQLSASSTASTPESSDSETKPTVGAPSQREEPAAERSENEKSAAPHRQAIPFPKAERRAQAPAEDDSSLLLAQRYLQGHGVPQDCSRGLSYLKEAVRKPSAHARSQMGALYATGTCVPQNRVEAYRWFTSALEVDPRNPWLARERDSLYGEMNRSERQQVGP